MDDRTIFAALGLALFRTNPTRLRAGRLDAGLRGVANWQRRQMAFHADLEPMNSQMAVTESAS